MLPLEGTGQPVLNRVMAAQPLTEEDLELAILEHTSSRVARFEVGDQLQAIGPADSPAQTVVRAVDLAAGGYRVDKWPGATGDFLAFTAEHMWHQVLA